MHWRYHMMAIVLAGGSVAACSDAGEVDTNGFSQHASTAAPAATTAAPRPELESTLPVDHAQQPQATAHSMGYTVPPCNANPDPCCRNPDLPGCHADAGISEPDAAADAADADPPDACSSQTSN